jgi:hypothetical protein
MPKNITSRTEPTKTHISLIGFLLRLDNFGEVYLSTRNINPIIQKENNIVKLPNGTRSEGREVICIHETVLPNRLCLVTASAFSNVGALKKIQANPTHIPVIIYEANQGSF